MVNAGRANYPRESSRAFWSSLSRIEEAEVNRQGVKRLSSYVDRFHPASRQRGGSNPLLLFIRPLPCFGGRSGFPADNLISYPPRVSVKKKCRKILEMYERQTPGNPERKTEAAFPDQTHGRADNRGGACGD